MNNPSNPFQRLMPTASTPSSSVSAGSDIGPSATHRPLSPNSPFAPRPAPQRPMQGTPATPGSSLPPRPATPAPAAPAAAPSLAQVASSTHPGFAAPPTVAPARPLPPPSAITPTKPDHPFAPRPTTPATPASGAYTPPPSAFTPPPAAAPAPVAAPAATGTGSASLQRAQLSPAQFDFFAKLIYELSGMKFEVNKSYFLASKIEQRIQVLALNGFDAYISYLNSPSGRTEYGHLIDEVSINETFFFRHEPQLQAFRNGILIPLAQARRAQGTSRLRIWSAASSTGDELYTLALMIREAGLWGNGLNWELVGTDICHDALRKAQAGIYRKYNVRNIPPALLQAHFVHDPVGPTGETWQIKEDIRNSCRFIEGNLMDPQRCGALGKFDIIFCRNVLIYFDEPSKERAVQNLANNLTEDGFVLLGHSENIYSQRHILRPVKEHAAAIAYQKAPPGTPKL